MHNNQKLLLTGLIAFGAAFGAWYYLQPAEIQANGPVSPKIQKQQDAETRRSRQMSLDFDEEVPEEHKKVENGLNDRWGHLGEDVLTAASVADDGEMLYYDKNVIVGRDGSGKAIFAQGAHRAFVMEGPLIREVTRKPITATIRPSKAPGSGFMFEALRSGGQKDRSELPMPAPKSPVSDN